MPRSRKCRRVCAEPISRRFLPDGDAPQMAVLTVEQLESLRLCDLENLSQDEAASRMGVSRGTFQRILYAARKEAAGALVNGYGIAIEGGCYQVAVQPCQGEEACCRCPFGRQIPKEMETP